MQAWQIFVQSVLRVFVNFQGAIRISALIYLVMTGLGIWFDSLGIDLSNREQMTAMMQAGTFPWLQMTTVGILSALGGLWVAVGWHRFVLLDEMPGFVPPFKGDRILGYLGRMILVVLALLPVYFVIVAISVGLFFALGRSDAGMQIAQFLPIIVIIPISAFVLRLSTALPGAALGAEGGIRSAWAATRGKWGTFLLLAIIVIAAGFAARMVMVALALYAPVMLIPFSIVYGWVSLMVGVSILTTLYGHYVEGRSLG